MNKTTRVLLLFGVVIGLVTYKASYSAPIIIQQAGRRVLVSWTGNNVVGLNPASGEVYWKYPFQQTRMVINVPIPVVSGDRLFVTSFFDHIFARNDRELVCASLAAPERP